MKYQLLEKENVNGKIFFKIKSKPSRIENLLGMRKNITTLVDIGLIFKKEKPQKTIQPLLKYSMIQESQK
jgi:hypothetical protein